MYKYFSKWVYWMNCLTIGTVMQCYKIAIFWLHLWKLSNPVGVSLKYCTMGNGYTVILILYDNSDINGSNMVTHSPILLQNWHILTVYYITI